LTDKPLGAGIADWMEVALDASTQMIAICSDAYFNRDNEYSRAERQSMFWADPTNNARC
jgi:uridine kinase